MAQLMMGTRKIVTLTLCLAAIAACSALGQSAPVSLAQNYQDGMTAFQMGDYQKAVTNLENLISQAEKSTQLEPVYFTLGAAYFNLKQYDKAIETLKKYVTDFPKGSRVAEAQFSIGQAHYLNKDYADAAESFKALEGYPQYKERTLYYEGSAYKQAGNLDGAVEAFKKLIGSEIESTQAANAAILLADTYAKKHDSANAIALLQRLQKKLTLVDNVVGFNTLAVQMGDEMLQANQPDVALACYRLVRTYVQVISYQTAHVQTLEGKVAQNLVAVRADPSLLARLSAENTQLRASIDEGKKLLEDFQKQPDFAPALLLRMGRSFSQLGKKWEAVTVFDELLRKYPERKGTRGGAFFDDRRVRRVVLAQEDAGLLLGISQEIPAGEPTPQRWAIC